MRLTLPRFCGLLTFSLAIELIAGWFLHIESMVRILPSSNSVSLNTAIAFLLAASALLAGQTERQVRWRKFTGWCLIIGASLILVEDIFDVALGIDWESLHRTVVDGSPRPGRVAPNTCLALLSLGIVFASFDRPPSSARTRLIVACYVLQAALICSGVVGLLLDPTLMFGWYKFNRMAAPTAFGLFLLMLGSYSGYRLQSASTTLSTKQKERSILFRGAMLLLSMGVAGALTTFIIFANSQQETIRNKLNSELLGQARLVEFVFDQAATEFGRLATRPLLLDLIRKNAIEHNPSDRVKLTATLQKLLAQGFTRITLTWADGSKEISVGRSLGQIELSVPLTQPAGDALLWSPEGYSYQGTSNITSEAGEIIGYLKTEWSLKVLSTIYMPFTKNDVSAEIVICGQRDNSVACFPSKLHTTPLFLLPTGKRERLPVDDALEGKTAIRTAVDYRGKSVVAAYSHIGATGLAFVSKVDAVELYQPINFLLTRSILVLGISLAVGIFLLRQMVGSLLTDIVKSETRAIQSEKLLKDTTENLPALIAYIDKDERYRFANAYYQTFLQINPAAMLGKTVAEIYGEKNYGKMAADIHVALSGKPVQFERHQVLAGISTHLSVTFTPDIADDGSVAGIYVMALDITARKQAELKQAESEERLRTIADNLPAQIAYIDKHQRYLFVNAALAQFVGSEPQKMLGKLVSETRSAELHAYVAPYITKALNGESVKFQGQTLSGGKTLYFECNFVPARTAEGEINGFYSMTFDITERVKIESLKNEFVSTVSHELRTPLTSINGALGLVLAGVAGEVPIGVNDLMVVARRNVERLIRMINDMLDIEKIESGNVIFDIQRHNLVSLIQNALESSAAYASEYDIHLRFTCALQNALCNVDQDRFTQVMINLISNASKFSREGGTVEIGLSLHQGSWLITVADQGCGIPEEFYDKIFTKFSQVDASNTRKKGGSGLGLSICKPIIEQMAGTIRFTSSVGIGTTFYIELPAVQMRLNDNVL